MISAVSQQNPYQTLLSNGHAEVLADTTADKGGGGQGFRPHELLEAAVASCMNMSLRMAAEQLGLKPGTFEVVVRLDRRGEAGSTFEYQVTFAQEVPRDQRAILLSALDNCPVRQTLTRPLDFQPV